jgi:hypothetical protein
MSNKLFIHDICVINTFCNQLSLCEDGFAVSMLILRVSYLVYTLLL